MKLTLRAFFVISSAIVFCVGGAAYAQSLTLELLTDPEPVLGSSESAPIQVRLSALDRPIPDADVSFTPMSDTADTYLSVLRDVTNSDGLAGSTIMAGVQAIDFDVRISASNYDVVPLTVHVRVASSAGLPEADYPGDFSSMQEAIDALEDGGTLRIASGIHEMEPTYIQGKSVHIEGSGPNCYIPGTRNRWSFGTVLVAPKVDRVTAPEEVQGSLHYIDAGGSVSNLRMSGGDAPIATRETGRKPSRPLTVTNTCLTHAVRGIHHKAVSPLTVADTVIRRMAWNGISIAPIETDERVNNTVINSFVYSVSHFCIFAMGSGNNYQVVIDDVFLVNCGGGVTSGGGIGVSKSLVSISDSDIVASNISGIWLEEVAGVLDDNLMINVKSSIFGNFGDGITAWVSPMVFLNRNTIWYPDRAGVSTFGSHLELEDNSVKCAAFDLQLEDYKGLSGVLVDNGGNWCGCPPYVNENCLAESVGLEPPPPIGGLE